MTSDGFADTNEVAALFGITPQRVHQLRTEHADFPTPIIARRRATFWKQVAIVRWGRKHGYITPKG